MFKIRPIRKRKAGLGGNPTGVSKSLPSYSFMELEHPELSDLHGEPNFGKPLFVTNQPSTEIEGDGKEEGREALDAL